MNYILLTLTTVLCSAQSVFKKAYNNRAKKPTTYFFTFLLTLTALLFFVFSSGFKLHFTWSLVPYAIAFAATYCMADVFMLLALRTGSLSLSSLISSFSLMLPAFYGIVFLKEATSPVFWGGIAMLAVSLVLVNLDVKNLSFSVKWLVFILLSFFGNGMCSVVQKMQNTAFVLPEGGVEGSSEFMILALAIVSVYLLIMSLVKEREKIKDDLAPRALIFPIGCGLANGAVNFLVILLNGRNFNASIMFPVISAGGIVITVLFAMFVYRERLSLRQLMGFAIGAVSIVFLTV